MMLSLTKNVVRLIQYAISLSAKLYGTARLCGLTKLGDNTALRPALQLVILAKYQSTFEIRVIPHANQNCLKLQC
jgi:hypothetical protein